MATTNTHKKLILVNVCIDITLGNLTNCFHLDLITLATHKERERERVLLKRRNQSWWRDI